MLEICGPVNAKRSSCQRMPNQFHALGTNKCHNDFKKDFGFDLILVSLSDPSISLDPSNIRGQAYDGASVMLSGKEGIAMLTA